VSVESAIVNDFLMELFWHWWGGCANGGFSTDFLFGRVDFGEFFAGDGFEFAADEVRGEAGAEEAAVEGGEFFFADFAFERAKFALDALADDGGSVGFVGGFRQGGLDMFIGDAAGAEIAGYAELALFADFGALAGELFGVAGVVELAGFSEAGQNDLCEEFARGAALKFFLHLLLGVGAAHQRAEGDVVEFGFGIELAGLAEHSRRIEVRK